MARGRERGGRRKSGQRRRKIKKEDCGGRGGGFTRALPISLSPSPFQAMSADDFLQRERDILGNCSFSLPSLLAGPKADMFVSPKAPTPTSLAPPRRRRPPPRAARSTCRRPTFQNSEVRLSPLPFSLPFPPSHHATSRTRGGRTFLSLSLSRSSWERGHLDRVRVGSRGKGKERQGDIHARHVCARAGRSACSVCPA